jgi:dienelactone hydrolase
MDQPIEKLSCCGHVPPPPTGTPRGQVRMVNEVAIYITGPPVSIPSERAILFLTEGHGILLPHAQLLADRLAEELACPVIAPELHNGNGFPMEKPADWDDEAELVKFVKQHHPATVDPILEKVLDFMSTEMSVGTWGAIGYCFGGRYVIRLMAAKKIVVGVVNHPSFFTMEEVEEFGRAKLIRAPGLLEGGERVEVKPPLAIFAAETDSIFPAAKRRDMEDRLIEAKATWMCATFSGVGHGFRYG